jgi:hypothetical protein
MQIWGRCGLNKLMNLITTLISNIAFRECHEKGRAMTIEQVIAYTVEKRDV